MSVTVHSLAIGTFVPMLRNLAHLLDKGAEHARATKLDALATARLAPDMYTLQQQVQLACFHALDANARLTGGEPLQHENVDETLDQLAARIERTIVNLERIAESAFAGAEKRAITIPLPDGEMAFEMTGYELLRDWAMPHSIFTSSRRTTSSATTASSSARATSSGAWVRTFASAQSDAALNFVVATIVPRLSA